MKNRNPDIVYEDDDYLFVSKPPGLLTIPDRFDPELPNLLEIFSQAREKIFIVHRLDKDTSGLIGFAKTAEAHRDLCIQFENHTVRKKYIALICGIPDPPTGTISFSLTEDSSKPGRMTVARKDGKEAYTEYKVTEKLNGFSLAEALPKTGRTHQIRVHFKAIGHPLAVDPLYGSSEGLYLSDIKKNYKPKPGGPEKPLIGRLTLHSFSLRFRHIRGNDIFLTAELPKDFRSVIQHLRKHHSSPE